PMFASYYFDDIFSSISFIFDSAEGNALGWDQAKYGVYTSAYSVLCIFGGLVLGGILLDKWGVRIAGSFFVVMMAAGAGLVLFALLTGGKHSLDLAYSGGMFFGLGSEIAGTAVNRSIAKWFKGGPLALAMGLQLAIARLGTAFAMVLAPKLVVQQTGHVYSLVECSRPALAGMGLMAFGLILWAVFVAIDSKAAEAPSGAFARTGLRSNAEEGASAAEAKGGDDDKFVLKDVLKVLGNKNFWLLGLLCVLFYSAIIAFKKFAGAILVPRFDIPAQTAGWMISMLPFSTVIFAPLFGLMVDKFGNGTRWMIAGSVLALAAHLLLAFAPQGVPAFGYLAMVLLGFGYSLVPAALWPSATKIVPEKVLGTTFALLFWVQNLGLFSFKVLAGKILAAGAGAGESAAAVSVEQMFVGLCVAAVLLAFIFARTSRLHPELRLDAPSRSSE
ncbi:MAG: MFS transporter, partial [Bacteroidales bacterium]|nr:MFS transporter [Bacteroidales bacterium]